MKPYATSLLDPLAYPLLLILAYILISANLAVADFLDVCGRMGDGRQWGISTDGTMASYCHEDTCTVTEYTLLNLNDCFENNDGQLKAKVG